MPRRGALSRSAGHRWEHLFTATDGHPFWVVSGERLDLRGDAEHVPLYEPLGTPRGRWVRAAELLPGDTVATRSGSPTVVRVAPHARPEVVYNLHVEGTARYLVGACGVVVHNSPCSEAAEQAGDVVTVRTYTSRAGRDAISESGHLRADTWVTLPSEIPTRAGRRQVEEILEIQPGRGEHYIDVVVERSNLRVPVNGSHTSGGAIQFQLNRSVPIAPDGFRRQPGRPRR